MIVNKLGPARDWSVLLRFGTVARNLLKINFEMGQIKGVGGGKVTFREKNTEKESVLLPTIPNKPQEKISIFINYRYLLTRSLMQ